MADRRILSSPGKRQQPTIHFLKDFEACLRRAEQQKALATEMIKKVHEMCERAAEMRNGPRLTLFLTSAGWGEPASGID